MIETYDDAVKAIDKLIAARRGRREVFERNLNYLAGDHWQNGREWGGAIVSGDGETAAWKNAIGRIFTPEDIVGDVVDKKIDAAMGSTPVWAIHGASDSDATDAAKLLKKWLRDTDAAEIVREAARDTQGARRGVIGLSVPPEYLVDGGIPKQSLVQALEIIELARSNPLSAGVTGRGSRRTSIILASTTTNSGKPSKQAEISYLSTTADGREITVLQTADEEGRTTPIGYDFGGQLTAFQLTDKILLTDAVIRAQRAANAHSTGLHESGVAAAFRSIITSNAFPFVEKKDPETGKTTLEPARFKMGHGAWINIVGVPTEDKKAGKRTYATPNVTVIDPVSPEAFKKRVEAFRGSIIRRVGQEHRLVNHGQVAEETVKELRRDFQDSVAPLARQIAAAYSWMLTTALKMAAQFAGEAEQYRDVYVVAEPSVSGNIITTSDQKEAREAVRSGFLSHETGLTRYGVDDTAAEMNKLQQEKRNEPKTANNG